MTSIKTEWNLADLGENHDPFGTVLYSTGLEIDLTGSEEELAKAMVRLLKIEGRVHKSGVSCGLKDAGQDCLTCQVSTLDSSEPRSRLCRLGKDQSTVEKMCSQRQAERTAAREEELAEWVQRVDEATEVGHLEDEWSELLTSVGL